MPQNAGIKFLPMEKLLHAVLIQYDVEWENIKSNLQKLDKLCSSVIESADIIILPEMFATGFTMKPEKFTEKDIRNILEWMLKRSVTNNSVLLGSVPYNDDGKYYNRLLITFPDGTHDFYDKRHLFTIGEEHQHYEAGSLRKIFTVKGWKVLPLVCYDLRFPVWSRNDVDYDLLIYSSNWPSVRVEVWDTLLKARAIENQAYVVGLNRLGTDGRDISYAGGSKVFSPKGEVILEMYNRESAESVELDSRSLMVFREKFPVLKDRDTFIFK